MGLLQRHYVLHMGGFQKGGGVACGHILPSGVSIQSRMLGPRLAAFIFGPPQDS